MINFDKDVVTGIYPRKTIDWTKVKRKVLDNPKIPEDELLAASLQYNLNVKDPDKIEMINGFIEVMDGATGFMLIKKRVFEQMAYNYPDKQFKPDQHINEPHNKKFDYHKNPFDKLF